MKTIAKRIAPYVEIMRVDHWPKNVLCLPGVVLAYTIIGRMPVPADAVPLILGFLSVCLTASANYTINEIVDAPYDREHPDKSERAIPSGLVSIPVAYAQYVALLAAALVVAYLVNLPFFLSMVTFAVMGVVYNVPPLRSKEVTYVDALTEAVNNPIRLALGWWMVVPGVWPPLSLIVAYWMLGAFLMALKRYAEYRHIGDHDRAVRYRASFKHTDDLRLLVSAVFYANAFHLFMGVFITKFRVELILAIPFLSLLIAYYLRIAFRENSVVQYPEKLYHEKKLMVMLAVTCVIILALLFIDLPFLHEWFRMREPAEPVQMGLLPG
jgi:4-hydroxybenzoate polyprenyltransferase